jgi:hypothetical protein
VKPNLRDENLSWSFPPLFSQRLFPHRPELLHQALEPLVLVLPESAPAPALPLAAAAVELVLLSYRNLRTRESEQKGIFPTTNRFFYP